VAQERGPKLRVVKFKPKRGYKRRTGHRQNLTRIEVTEISVGGGGARKRGRSAAPAPVAADSPAPAEKEASDGA
jgi:large subunit ribosomal protein L21